jgi:hypothetical protein
VSCSKLYARMSFLPMSPAKVPIIGLIVIFGHALSYSR